MKNKILISLSMLALLACGKKESDIDSKPKPVIYDQVEVKNYSVKRTYSGTINTEAQSNISFRVSGTINNRIAQLGDVVKKGDILATLDPIEYQLNYQQSISNLSKGNANLVEATSSFKRSEALYLENSISKASYDSATATYQSAISEVKSLQDAANLSKVQLGYATLTAPADGSIGEVKSEVNQNVSASTVVFVLNTAGERYAEFNVSQTAVGEIKMGDTVELEIISLNNYKLNGTITNIGTLSVGYGATYPVKARIEDKDNLIKVGMTAKVTVTTNNTDSNFIAVPISAILTDPNNEKYVYIISDLQDKVGIAKKQTVTLGRSTENGVEIVTGLKAGDYIVTKGSSVILENQKVSLLKGAE